MADEQPLSAREFYLGVERIEKRMDRGFADVNETLREQGERIAVLEAARKTEVRDTRKRATAWGSAIAGVVLLVIETFKALKSNLAQ